MRAGRVRVPWVLPVWALTVGVWVLLGAPPSATRWLGTLLLITLPAPLWWWGNPAVRNGLAAAGAVVIVFGGHSSSSPAISLGTAVGAITVWAGVALALSGSGALQRRSGLAIGASGLSLQLATSTGPTGPRVAGAALAIIVGVLVGRTIALAGADVRNDARAGTGRTGRGRERVAAGGALLLIGLAGVRTVLDLDTPARAILVAARRFASFVLPSDVFPTVGGSSVPIVTHGLPWAIPLVAGAVAIAVLARGGALAALRSRAVTPATAGASRERPRSVPLRTGPATLLVVGLVATVLLDLVAVNWASHGGTGLGDAVLWPGRQIETVLWGALAVATGQGWRLRAHPAASAVTAVTTLVLLTVLVSEWRVDGVALRPGLLAVPMLFIGLVALARSGPRAIITGLSIAATPVLLAGMLVGMRGIGPSRSGRRSIIPGDGPLLIDGFRLAGLMPDAGQLGLIAAVIALAAVPLVISPLMSSRTAALPGAVARSERTGRARTPPRLWLLPAWSALLLGTVSVLLAEAKMVLLAVGLAAPVAVLAHRSAIGRQGWRRHLGVSAGVGSLVVAAPFLGARFLDPNALRPEVWRRSIEALEGAEWLIGLGAQPLRVDRAFHARVDSSWGAVQAHNQALEFLLIAGLPGLLVMLVTVTALLAAGLGAAHIAYGWPLGAAVFLVVAGAAGPNLTYFGHDVAFVLLSATMVAVLLTSRRGAVGVADPPGARAVAQRPQLLRLEDDPSTLPRALEGSWAAGHAVVVAPVDGALPPQVQAYLEAGEPGRSTALPSGTALVVPTSGSTGAARAVILSHAALSASTAASLAALGCAPGERWALALPVRHTAGLQVLARARALGTAPLIVADPGDPHSIAAAADHAKHIALVPTQLMRCLDAGADVVAALARLRSVLVGGGPLDPVRAAQARAAGVRLVQSYGMTETCGGCVYDGRPFSGVEIDIEPDEATGSDGGGGGGDGDGGIGRIRLRGPMLATGYLGATPADAARFTPDGWFVTDDVGRLIGAGDGQLLEVVSRVDGVINTGGVKVVPAVVEDALRDLAGVHDVVVHGVADPEWGERVRAVVVPADPAHPPTLAMLRAATEHLPAGHAPRELVLVEDIVRDGLGKVSAAERERLRRC